METRRRQCATEAGDNKNQKDDSLFSNISPIPNAESEYQNTVTECDPNNILIKKYFYRYKSSLSSFMFNHPSIKESIDLMKLENIIINIEEEELCKITIIENNEILLIQIHSNDDIIERIKRKIEYYDLYRLSINVPNEPSFYNVIDNQLANKNGNKYKNGNDNTMVHLNRYIGKNDIDNSTNDMTADIVNTPGELRQSSSCESNTNNRPIVNPSSQIKQSSSCELRTNNRPIVNPSSQIKQSSQCELRTKYKLHEELDKPTFTLYPSTNKDTHIRKYYIALGSSNSLLRSDLSPYIKNKTEISIPYNQASFLFGPRYKRISNIQLETGAIIELKSLYSRVLADNNDKVIISIHSNDIPSLENAVKTIKTELAHFTTANDKLIVVEKVKADRLTDNRTLIRELEKYGAHISLGSIIGDGELIRLRINSANIFCTNKALEVFVENLYSYAVLRISNLSTCELEKITEKGVRVDLLMEQYNEIVILTGLETLLIDLLEDMSRELDRTVKVQFLFEKPQSYRTILCGKKDGKIQRIVNRSKAEINIIEKMELEKWTIEVKGEVLNVIESTKLIRGEFIRTSSFYINEKYHRELIGNGGQNIQRYIKEYRIYIKFLDKLEIKSLFGCRNDLMLNDYIKINNVLMKGPEKNSLGMINMENCIKNLVGFQEIKRIQRWIYIESVYEGLKIIGILNNIDRSKMDIIIEPFLFGKGRVLLDGYENDVLELMDSIGKIDTKLELERVKSLGEDMNEDDVSKGDIGGEGMSKDDMNEGMEPNKEGITRDISKEDISQIDTAKEELSKDISQVDITEEGIANEDIGLVDTTKEDISQSDISKDIVKEDIGQSDIRQADIGLVDTTKEDISQSDIDTEELSKDGEMLPIRREVLFDRINRKDGEIGEMKPIRPTKKPSTRGISLGNLGYTMLEDY
eukprot:GHVP01052679.1.p1 GENE.GHVP01052679.1~~GHVP01052679.1.p1  ORF type:complete len:923 (+),score=131.51 GHVP01052679.1:759-3527(+)